jgi:predicted nucleotidyltransferase
MKQKIVERLKSIEHSENIKVLLAVESGSRAWGFASNGSDWVVRFICIQQPDWYLSIDDKRDSLEYPADHLLDFSGWELRKALRLFRK